MRVISLPMIREFIAKHADADVPLRDWYKRTCNADWTCFADIKKTFNTVDYVGNDRYVFDIKGNNYRIVAIVLFVNKKVYMRFVGTHEEYDKIKVNEDEDLHLPTAAVVLVIVLSSLVGILIICEAIYGF